MKTSLAERLKGITNNTTLQTNIATVPTNPVITEIKSALNIAGFDSIMIPNDIELAYVSSVFQNKGFYDINNVTYESVDVIAKSQFIDLNNKLKEFTKSMNSVKTPGLFTLIDELNKNVQDSELELIWEKTVNAKPTFGSKVKALFNKAALKESVNNQLKSLQDLLSNRSNSLETKLNDLEKKLTTERNDQDKNIKVLEKTYEIYYASFMELRKQFALIVFLEHSFKIQLQNFKNAHEGKGDLILDKKLQDFDRILVDIENKRLIIHKALLQLPITATQNNNLISVCQNLLKEIDNTLISSFPSIRSNLINIGISIVTQNALLSNNSTQELDRSLSILSSKVSADLAIKGQQLSSESRLREAQTIQILVNDLKEMKQRLDHAKQQSQTNIKSATDILSNATLELKEILGT